MEKGTVKLTCDAPKKLSVGILSYINEANEHIASIIIDYAKKQRILKQTPNSELLSLHMLQENSKITRKRYFGEKRNFEINQRKAATFTRETKKSRLELIVK